MSEVILQQGVAGRVSKRQVSQDVPAELLPTGSLDGSNSTVVRVN
ncbi:MULTISPECIES: hypothetical protein [Limnobaculum]|nr:MULTISPECIES: hypothetical protein [Limnobaculum]